MARLTIIRRSEVLKRVPDDWASQYSRNPDPDKRAITSALLALDRDKMTEDQVNGIIGNKSWTSLACDVCNEEKPVLVRIGDKPDYEARWQDVCRSCLILASDILGSDARLNGSEAA